MSRLAKLQLIGPIALLIGIAGAEGTALALAHAPGSEATWYLHLNVFGPFRPGDEILGAYLDLAHGQLYLIGLPLFLAACGGFYFRRMLPVAIASNLSFIYASLLVYAWWAHEPLRLASLAGIGDVIAADVYSRVTLFGCALLSFAASHIVYIRAIRRESVFKSTDDQSILSREYGPGADRGGLALCRIDRFEALPNPQ